MTTHTFPLWPGYNVGSASMPDTFTMPCLNQVLFTSSSPQSPRWLLKTPWFLFSLLFHEQFAPPPLVISLASNFTEAFFLMNNLLEGTSSVQTHRCDATRSWGIKCNQEVRGLPSKKAGQKSEVSFLLLMLYLFPSIPSSLPILFPQAHRWPFFCVNLFLSVLVK